jgi:hypothetical protein
MRFSQTGAALKNKLEIFVVNAAKNANHPSEVVIFFDHVFL